MAKLRIGIKLQQMLGPNLFVFLVRGIGYCQKIGMLLELHMFVRFDLFSSDYYLYDRWVGKFSMDIPSF